jgi:hypothetical protein
MKDASHNHSQDEFGKLYDELKNYVDLQTEYVKVAFVEKLTILLSAFFIISLTLALAFGALFYFCFSLVHIIESFTGTEATAFALVALCYVALIVVVVAFRKKLIINPIVRFLSKLFLNSNEH